eukprot:6140199-Lingulodinium_polyedra.AAC.1
MRYDALCAMSYVLCDICDRLYAVRYMLRLICMLSATDAILYVPYVIWHVAYGMAIDNQSLNGRRGAIEWPLNSY